MISGDVIHVLYQVETEVTALENENSLVTHSFAFRVLTQHKYITYQTTFGLFGVAFFTQNES